MAFFLLYQASFCEMAGRCVCSLGMTQMFLCEMGWNRFSHRVFRTVERILFCVFFFFKRLAFSMSVISTTSQSVHPPACFRVCRSRLHPDAFFVRGPFLRLLLRVRTCHRYLTKAKCLLYYQHELPEHKRLQSFIQWHWGAVGGYIKAPYLPLSPHFNEKQDSPALTKPAICVSVLSLACMFVVFVCTCCCVAYMLV